MKAYAVIMRRRDINIAVNSLANIYKQNEKSSKDNSQILEMCSLNAFRITKALTILYSLCGIMFGASPIILHLIFGTIEPAVPIFLPKVDISTTIGFVTTWIYHVYILFTASIGFIFCDALYGNLVLHVSMMSGLITNQWNVINEQMQRKNTSSLEVKSSFRNVCKMHQEMTT